MKMPRHQWKRRPRVADKPSSIQGADGYDTNPNFADFMANVAPIPIEDFQKRYDPDRDGPVEGLVAFRSGWAYPIGGRMSQAEFNAIFWNHDKHPRVEIGPVVKDGMRQDCLADRILWVLNAVGSLEATETEDVEGQILALLLVGYRIVRRGPACQ